jgi:hypothetical protein
MNAKLNKEGKLEIDLSSLFDSMLNESKLILIESLSCEDSIIKHVVDQILYGFTENVYSGGSRYGEADNLSPLDDARRKVAKGASEVSEKIISELEWQVKREKEQAEKYMEAYFKLYHAWPRDYPKPQTGIC